MAEPTDIEQLDDTVRARWATIEANVATIEGFPGRTIVPAPLKPGSTGRRALEQLGAPSQGGSALPALQLEGTLGEGGMGIVRLATQTCLGRKVAVKTLREEHRDQASMMKLLREAWVTGSLEHPNVLPIYDLALDDEGVPLVVLKRIEGLDWAELIDDDEAAGAQLGEGELLEHNLNILMQVCRAVSFAHSRGVVHRDLKPDNVRIGDFGEVYVLDWGIAVSLQDDGSGRFPLATAATELAGTPAYMAPEMLGGRPLDITERTDVYLLGAILHEMLTGQPPHQGDTAVTIVSSVLKSAASFASVDEAHRELVEISRRCMAAEPAERYASADEVRLELRQFSQHRGSMELVSQAYRRLRALEEVLAGAHEGGEQRVLAYKLHGECHFGFQQGLESWPENELARAGLEAVTLKMIDFELSQGDGHAAWSLHEQLEQCDEALHSRIRRAMSAQDKEAARLVKLEELGQQLDPSIGKRTRTGLIVILGAWWTASPMFMHFYPVGVESYHWGALFWNAITGIMGLLLAVWARDSLTKTLVNRRLTLSVGVMLGATMLASIMALILALPPALSVSIYFLVWTTVALMEAVAVEPKLWPCTVFYAAALFASLKWPPQRYLIMAIANFLMTVTCVVAWKPDLHWRKDGPAPSKN